MARCADCRKFLAPDWAHCPFCGSEHGFEKCAYCLKRIEAGWHYCAACGEPVTRAGEQLAQGWAGVRPECRILHLTDLHMTETPETGLTEKSWLGNAPIAVRLKGILEQEVGQVDHILVTGDYTDTGADAEYEQVLKIFEDTGCRDKLTVIPGNHELVQGGVFSSANKAEQMQRFLRWSRSYLPAEINEKRPFPFVRWIASRLAFIGLDTTGEGRSLYTSSSGCIDDEQLEALDAILGAMPDGIRKLIGIHHSFYPPKVRKSFIDSLRDRFFMHMENSDNLRDLLMRYKNVIVVHGHHHVELIHEEDPEEGRIINLGASSSTLPDEESEQLHYVIMEFYDDAIVSVKRTYADLEDAAGITLVGEPVRRRFTLEPVPVPASIQRILKMAHFLRSARDRLTLKQWRGSGAIDKATQTALKVPGFLRSAGEKLSLRKKGYGGGKG